MSTQVILQTGKKSLVFTVLFLIGLHAMHAAEAEKDPEKHQPVTSTLMALDLPLTQVKTPYLCQFVFMAFDAKSRQPLDITFSRAAFRTATVLLTKTGQ
jgi:hypothetical protein